MSTDKLNRVDYHWFLIRTQPRQEKLLTDLLAKHKQASKNILEVYCPSLSGVGIRREGGTGARVLFTGIVFVLSTLQAITDFLEQHFPQGALLYDYSKKTKTQKAPILTIPEKDMRMFKDFNENYSDQMVILERPYSDYAFNPKTNEPNDIVKVIDGPLAGKEGYITKFRRDKRLVFHMRGFGQNKDIAVSIPNIWNFHVVRVHNAEGDKQTIGTIKERAVDLLIGMLQGCGYGEQTLPTLYEIVDELTFKPSLVDFCKSLYGKGHMELSQRIARLDTKNAELILNLIRYENDNPGYVRSNWDKLVIRPFLTPTPGVEMAEGQGEAELKHESFTETIRKVDITEEVYYPSKEEGGTITTTYYAHIGMKQDENNGSLTLFANWDYFLSEYFMTGGKANEKLVGGEQQHDKLIDSFRNYAPTLYKVLTDEKSSVKAVKDFKIGGERLNVMAIANISDIDNAKDELINTCVNICKEINTTTHLAVWRRYLRTVWLHI